MRKAIFSLFLSFASLFCVLQGAHAANPGAAAIFDTIGGTTSIDQGGAIHSQTRSIFSLGGGQASFQGKRVSLLSADPPSFSAGCSGISWHFGGFAFISMDEIRQLVEAVAQASLGVAVDLAMQVLCPQCYAVMTKLRDIANAMRNAAADACKIAQGLGRMVQGALGIQTPEKRQTECASESAGDGKSTGFLNSAAGALCRGIKETENFLTTKGTDFMKWANGDTGVNAPDQAAQAEFTNQTYRALTALGYPDGFTKDLMMSLLGMSVIYPVPGNSCVDAFKGMLGSPTLSQTPDPVLESRQKEILGTISSRDLAKTTAASVNPIPPTGSAPAKTSATAAKKGYQNCYAPPLLSGMGQFTDSLLCGSNPATNMTRFRNLYFKGDAAAMAASSIGLVCAPNDFSQFSKDAVNPFMYHCTGEKGDCLEPRMVRAATLYDNGSVNGFDGLLWMVADSLYGGVLAIKENRALPLSTVRILNGSGYPLYRLLNMAAVYPGLADELLSAYSATIATQYAVDTLDKIAMIGAQPAIDLKLAGGIQPNVVSDLREHIMGIMKYNQENKSRVLSRLAEKRGMVDVIMQVNRALQAEVISKGLGGNANMAISLKRQMAEDTFTGPPGP